MDKTLVHKIFPENNTPTTLEKLNALLGQYEWYLPLRRLKSKHTHQEDARVNLMLPWRNESSLDWLDVDFQKLMVVSEDEIIDRFLATEDLRIVADEDPATDDICLQPDFDDEDELVTEQLAKIYLDQGIYDRALAIYRKLSLLNPEKSVYFAALISEIEKK